MRHSVRALFTAAGVALGADAAAGADLGRDVYKASPAMVSAPYNWTGFYVGGNIGYSWGRADADVAASDTLIDGIGLPDSSFSERLKPRGIIGGAQAGWNSQVGNWVFGLEADLQASGQKDNRSRNDAFDVEVCLVGIPGFCAFGDRFEGTAASSLEAKLTWFGTARVRLGYAWDGFMLYGTGGLAYGNFRLSGTSSVSGTATGLGIGCIPLGCTPQPFSGATRFSHSESKAGWTLGGGIEGAAWAPNWTWKLEYLYMDFGSFEESRGTSTGRVTTRTDLTDHVVRVGLNYRFASGKAPAPVMTRY